MAQNKLIPEYKNPPPPPPLTDEGKKWASYYWRKFDEWQEEKEDLQEQSKNAIDDVVNFFNIPPQAIGVRNMTESELLKEEHNYVRMALTLTGFKLDNEAAALITETVKKVLELGGEFSLDTAREVEARVNQMYDEDNV